MNISINAVFRKDRLNSQNAAPVHLRLTQNRKLKHISTGVTLNINEWDFENQRVMGQTPELQALQLRIDTKIDELRRKIKRLEALEVEVTLDNLLETNGRKINCTVGEYLKQTIERLETLGKYGSASKHRSLLSRLSQFRSLNIRFDEIDLAYLHDFELFLRKEGNTNNSIATKYAIFKAAYNKALAEGLFVPKTTPFTKYKVGSLWTRTRKRAITKEDIQKLVALEIAPNYRTDYAEFARDIFLFSYYTAGINFTDMATLRYCDIVDGRIYYSRHKTQKLLSFQLVPNALQIIEKYSKANHAQEDYIFPILDRSEHKTAQQIFNRTAQGSAESQSGIKDAGRADRIGNAIDYLCRSAHVRNGLEAVGSEYCYHFRIVGTFRFIHHSNLFGFVSKIAKSTRPCRIYCERKRALRRIYGVSFFSTTAG